MIGNTCLNLALKQREFEDDIDLFVTSLSPLIDEDKIRESAYRNGWSVGFTELGTLSLVLNIENTDIKVDLYENIHDFYIPNEALDICKRRIVVEGTEINYVAVECWAVFKAKRGSNQDLFSLSKLKVFVDEGEIKLDLGLMRKIAELYEDESRFIYDRLRALGFKV